MITVLHFPIAGRADSDYDPMNLGGAFDTPVARDYTQD
jgi:hypothetical protein